MKVLKTLFLSVILITVATSLKSQTNITSWEFNSLSSIGGANIVTEGDPEIIGINGDSALYFDGDEDRIEIPQNPISGLDEFSFEVVFRVDEGGIAEQKFLHLQANPDVRILFELEFTTDSTWYMENFIQNSDGESIHLMDAEKLHPVNRWFHAAVVFKDGMFTQYINYKKENAESLAWTAPTDGSVSVGARMNKVNYMKGAVRQIRFADAALDSSQFLFYGVMLEQSEMFVLDNLENISGYDVQVFGNPQVVETEIGLGIDFDGNEDGIYILTNPLLSADRFTIETIIKPNDVFPNNWEPRYLHIESPTNSNRRLTMELRLNDNHEWYFDGFLRSESGSLGLIDENLTHPVEGWEHIAVTYSDGVFKTYVNGVNELSGNFDFLPISANARMSLGMRMNNRAYFNGIIQRVRITHAELDSSEFMNIYADASGNQTSVKKINPDNLNLDLKLNLYPNPAKETTTLHITSARDGDIKVSVYNLAGVRVKEDIQARIRRGVVKINIDLQKLRNGIYLVEVGASENRKIRSLIVN